MFNRCGSVQSFSRLQSVLSTHPLKRVVVKWTIVDNASGKFYYHPTLTQTNEMTIYKMLKLLNSNVVWDFWHQKMDVKIRKSEAKALQQLSDLTNLQIRTNNLKSAV